MLAAAKHATRATGCSHTHLKTDLLLSHAPRAALDLIRLNIFIRHGGMYPPLQSTQATAVKAHDERRNPWDGTVVPVQLETQLPWKPGWWSSEVRELNVGRAGLVTVIKLGRPTMARTSYNMAFICEVFVVSACFDTKEVWIEEVSDTVVKLLRAFPKVTQCEYD